MGWWNYGIMDGDTPLDIESTLLDVAGVPVFDYMECGQDGFREEIESNIEKMINCIDTKIISWGNDDYAIAHQVLGTILMRSGCSFDESIRERILTNGNNDDSETFRDPVARRNALLDFKQMLTEYDISGGTPTEIKSTGLFETMFQELK